MNNENSMPDTSTTNLLLYSPFSKDYHVSPEIATKMTEKEFIEKCFVDVDFKSARERLEDAEAGDSDYIDEASDGSTFDVTYERIAEKKKIEEQKQSYDAFFNWLKDNGNGIYCIKGDAGTGKTTFLHNLEYLYRNGKRPEADKGKKKYLINIIDLQDAVYEIPVYSKTIPIRDFGRLDSMVISALLRRIMRRYFIPSTSIDDILDNIQKLIYRHNKTDKRIFLADEVKLFFDDAEESVEQMIADSRDPGKNKRKKHEEFETFTGNICTSLSRLIEQADSARVIDRLLDVYMTMLAADHPVEKHIIAFDNIERFINAHEIFNPQLEELVENLRHISDTYEEKYDGFASKFQFVILMRNTSSRMVIPLQSADFGGHDLDLSGWFPVDTIISQKLDWYNENDLSVGNGNIIAGIIGKDSFDGHGIRSLQEKLGKLLNRDKRIIVNMLDRGITMTDATNPRILKLYKRIIDAKDSMGGLRRFAARSIVMRIVLDVMKEDSFFEQMHTQKKEDGFVRMGYSRKILTNLYEHYLDDEHHGYMHFIDLISRLVGNTYFDDNNASLRKIISDILFAMSYYNRRENNWLRLIDIQYNQESGSKVIANGDDLNKLLFKHPDKIGIKIVEAGIGYLEYVVQSFEYYSCRHEEKYQPPLLCLVPTELDLRCKNVESMDCYKVMVGVKNDAISCIHYMKQHREHDVPFRRNKAAARLTHTERVVYSHIGYISNFMDFVNKYYENKNLDADQKKKLRALNFRTERIRSEYARELPR